MGFRISGLLRASGFEAIGFWDQGLESRTVVGLQWRERIIFSQNSDYKAEKDFSLFQGVEQTARLHQA